MGLFDGIFDNKPQTEAIKSTNKLTKIEKTSGSGQNKKSFDPRPDLKDDTILWSQLLMYAQDMDPSLGFYGILLGFREMGTRLIIITDHRDPYYGDCRMRGQFDKTGADHWATPVDYRAAAIKYLGPADNPNKYGRMLKEALSKLGLKKAA
jgi:hypothetical protein